MTLIKAFYFAPFFMSNIDLKIAEKSLIEQKQEKGNLFQVLEFGTRHIILSMI